MFRVNFRIPIGSIHGTNIYLNGSFISISPFQKGDRITVAPVGKLDVANAEVIESLETSNYLAADEKWIIV